MFVLTIIGRILSPNTWIFFCALYVMAVLTFGICSAIQSVAGSMAYGLNKVGRFFHVHNLKLEAVSALFDGGCSKYEQLSTLFVYFGEKLVGIPTCAQMRWYESITLTRVFVSYPLKLIGCAGGLKDDLCAGIVGGKHLGQFIYQKGIWIFLGLYLLSPVAFWLLERLRHECKKGAKKFKIVAFSSREVDRETYN